MVMWTTQTCYYLYIQMMNQALRSLESIPNQQVAEQGLLHRFSFQNFEFFSSHILLLLVVVSGFQDQGEKWKNNIRRNALFKVV